MLYQSEHKRSGDEFGPIKADTVSAWFNCQEATLR